MTDPIMKDATKKDLDINWIGLDGFLIALYFIIVGIIFYALKTENDFIIGKFIPYSVMAAVTLIFFTYIWHVISFVKDHHEKNHSS